MKKFGFLHVFGLKIYAVNTVKSPYQFLNCFKFFIFTAAKYLFLHCFSCQSNWKVIHIQGPVTLIILFQVRRLVIKKHRICQASDDTARNVLLYIRLWAVSPYHVQETGCQPVSAEL
jgi:hypothetical protein